MKVSRKRFETLVATALDGLPASIQEAMSNVDVVIEEWPTDQQYAELGLAPEEWLFGLYEGTPLIERGVLAEPLMPDKITIFKGPLEEACESDEQITDEIRRTVVHEVAHHFGIDEDRLAELGYD
ncbi:MAG TPA: metallopeptidase family protein [bacterium]|nr:metallopeptidase family protein [bacterium]